MQGLHLTADLYQCDCSQTLLVEAEQLAELCRRYTVAVGLTLVDEKWFTFPEYEGQPGGVTGMLLLAESHLAVHTWPERSGVTLDVYVCNFTGDNSGRAEKLINELVAAFKPASMQSNRILRGADDPVAGTDELVLENLTEYSAYGYRIKQRLLTQHTPYQMLEVFDTQEFGKVMRLDGHFMTSDKEEFYYHEALVHPAAMSHPAPRQALIIGGGDGGAAEELLKHPLLERVVLAELDPEVIDVAKQYFGAVHRGVFDNPRLQVRIGDGFQYMQETADRFDLVLMDLTDPDTPASSLYSAESFTKVQRVLSPGGALVLHIGSPVFHPERVRSIAADLKRTFKAVNFYGLYIPLYGAYWGLAVASDSLDPCALSTQAVVQSLSDRNITDLRYYNEDIHHALFALPNFYRDLITTGI